MVTPMQDALSDGIPMICLSGQVGRKSIGTEAFQECDAVNITKGCTKWNKLVKDVNELPFSLMYGITCALTPPYGPVHIDLPKDIAMDVIEKISIYDVDDDYMHEEYMNYNIDFYMNMIEESKKPLIIAGAGAKSGYESVRRVQSKFNIPVCGTLHGLGVVDERDELSLKMCGMHGNAATNYLIQESDLLIGLGNRFDDRTTGVLDKYAPNANKIHINIDNGQLNRVVDSVNYNGDVGEFCDKLLYYDFINENTEWIKRVEDMKDKYKFKADEKLDVPYVIDEINSYIRYNDISPTFFTGVGNHQMFCAQYIDWTRPNQMISSGSLGVMGVGLPYAIGYGCNKIDETLILIDGDGSFNMTYNDLRTLMDNNIPLKIFIMNDGRKQMVHVWQELFYENRIITTKHINPKYEYISKAFDIPYIRINDVRDLRENMDKIFGYDSVIVDCGVMPGYCYPLVPPGKGLDEMILNKTKLDGDAPC